MEKYLAKNNTADLIEMLAISHKAKTAYQNLMEIEVDALPAIQLGLQHCSSDVRFYCCRFLDRYLHPDILPDLINMLNDDDERVRMTTLHTLACDRCKEGSCRPGEAEILPLAIKLLKTDNNAHVRAIAAEVVGHYVHENSSAIEALEAAKQSDESSTVRKKAGWYAPGGTIFAKTLPKPRRL